LVHSVNHRPAHQERQRSNPVFLRTTLSGRRKCLDRNGPEHKVEPVRTYHLSSGATRQTATEQATPLLRPRHRARAAPAGQCRGCGRATEHRCCGRGCGRAAPLRLSPTMMRGAGGQVTALPPSTADFDLGSVCFNSPLLTSTMAPPSTAAAAVPPSTEHR